MGAWAKKKGDTLTYLQSRDGQSYFEPSRLGTDRDSYPWYEHGYDACLAMKQALREAGIYSGSGHNFATLGPTLPAADTKSRNVRLHGFPSWGPLAVIRFTTI